MNEPKKSLIESIAFDIDDTVLVTAKVLMEYYNKLYGTSLRYENWNHHKTTNHESGFDSEAALRIFEELAIAHMFPIAPGAKKVLCRIYEATEEPLTFITARRPMYAKVGLDFLYQELQIPVCVQSSNDKGVPYATKLSCLLDMGISTLVEDQAFEASSYLEAGVRVILFERPWNKEDREKINHQNFIVVKTWDDVENVLFGG